MQGRSKVEARVAEDCYDPFPCFVENTISLSSTDCKANTAAARATTCQRKAQRQHRNDHIQTCHGRWVESLLWWNQKVAYSTYPQHCTPWGQPATSRNSVAASTSSPNRARRNSRNNRAQQTWTRTPDSPPKDGWGWATGSFAAN